MKKTLKVLTFFTLAVLLNLTSAAAGDDWQTEFITALQDGKTSVTLSDADQGLAYTASEEQVLMDAVVIAFEKNASACECMKIAIDLEYNPYSVLKSIYSAGGNIKLDQLCMCATEAGIIKAIIAKAASDALSPAGEPRFDRDEITQSQCLRADQGLAYTEILTPMSPIKTRTNDDKPFASVSSF